MTSVFRNNFCCYQAAAPFARRCRINLKMNRTVSKTTLKIKNNTSDSVHSKKHFISDDTDIPIIFSKPYSCPHIHTDVLEAFIPNKNRPTAPILKFNVKGLAKPFCTNINYQQRTQRLNNSLLKNQIFSLENDYHEKCFSQRCFSSTSGTTHDGSSNENNSAKGSNPLQKLPRRLLKRLEKKGISETQFLSKLNSSSLEENAINTQTQKTFTGSKEDLEELLRNMSTEPKYLSETDSFPSDMKRYKHWKKQEFDTSSKPKVAPSLTSVVLFPGQGSQFVGMGKKLLHFPAVNDIYDEASSILGYDLLSLCLRGPKSELDKTLHCQPAVMITSLAAIEKFREEHPQAVENCVATAGFSVGEFAALVFSGVLSFPDAVKLVKVRAEAMQKASETVGGGMLTVFLAHDSDLKAAIRTAKEYCQERRGIEDPVCMVANYLFPECKVLAGHEEALEFISTNAKEFNILKTKRLPVSGAFHTKLMESAVQPLQKALAGMKVGSPKLTVYSNVTNAPYHPKNNFSYMLAQQLVKPVKWEQIMHGVYSRCQGLEFPNTYEVGPGRQMGTLLKQVNLQAYKQYHSVDV